MKAACLPRLSGVFRLVLTAPAAAGLLCFVAAFAEGNEPVATRSGGGVPEPVTEADVAALKAGSPFLRPLDLSQSVSLKGVSRIEGHLYATLFERDTKKTYIVSASANDQGWRLVGVEGNQSDLKTVTAQISMGGEVFAVHFEESQLQPVPKKGLAGAGGLRRPGEPGGPPTNYREGISGDGFRGPPPPEVVEKLSRLSDDRRERLIRYIGEIRDRHPEMSSDDRRALFVRMLDRAVQTQPR